MSRRKKKLPIEVRIFKGFSNLMIILGFCLIFESLAQIITSRAAEQNIIYIVTEAAEENIKTPSPVPSSNSTPFYAFANLNIRSTPSFDGEVIANIPENGIINNVISTDGDWALIQYSNITGYVNSTYIGTSETKEEYLKNQQNIETQVLKCSSYLEQNYGFTLDQQLYLFNKCKSLYSNLTDQLDYYYYALAVIQRESDFKKRCYHKNSNGSTDLGLMQVNSCLWKELKQKGIISSSEDLYDPYININAGFYELDQCVAKYGLTENAYYMYNTGKSKKPGTNKNSHIVWGYFLDWKNRFETN